MTGGVEARLIPAHAGKTRPHPRAFTAIRAHPRSRGENLRISRPMTPSSGSSPLTRGKLDTLAGFFTDMRLIPAHAGKTAHAVRAHTQEQAHPRSRGENTSCIRVWGCIHGSSPLTRGKHGRRTERDGDWRLIPAHAGKTCCRVLSVSQGVAHPRSRGENLGIHAYDAQGKGSSPLTRGKLRYRGARRSS